MEYSLSTFTPIKLSGNNSLTTSLQGFNICTIFGYSVSSQKKPFILLPKDIIPILILSFLKLVRDSLINSEAFCAF